MKNKIPLTVLSSSLLVSCSNKDGGQELFIVAIVVGIMILIGKGDFKVGAGLFIIYGSVISIILLIFVVLKEFFSIFA